MELLRMTGEDGGFFLHVTRAEAMLLIKSLAAQIVSNDSNDSNSSREEWLNCQYRDARRTLKYTRTGYFSIAVKPEVR